MIKLPEFVDFKYSEPEWDQIKGVVRDALRREFDQIDGDWTWRSAASVYLPRGALNRQRLSRDELERCAMMLRTCVPELPVRSRCMSSSRDHQGTGLNDA